jgi:beta-lactamase superfamily II metal-dependent hydrolase
MKIEIFDVAHGACALLTCDGGQHLMIDCSTDAATNWRPGTHLRSRGVDTLDMLAITNYDEDHVRGIGDLLDKVDVRWLARNPTVSPEVLQTPKSDDGMGAGIERLAQTIPRFGASGNPPVFPRVAWSFFYNKYPSFDDENNLSMVVHLNLDGIGFLFPGDLERAGWLQLLTREDFQQAVLGTKS